MEMSLFCKLDSSGWYLFKGPSKNVNIFMSVQTIHFFRPPPPPLQVYRPIFLVSKIWVSRKTFIVQQQKFTLILSLFDM